MARYHVMVRSELTDEEKTKLFALTVFWSGEATSTAPANRSMAEAAIDAVYALSGRRPPKKRWVSSPLSAAIDAAEDIDECITYYLEKILFFGARDIADSLGFKVEELLADRSTRLFLPVGFIGQEDEERHMRMRRRPPVWQINRINGLIDNRINAVVDALGWEGTAQDIFMRGALDPFDVYKAEALASVLDISDAHPLLAFSMLARSAGFVLPLEERAWLCERPTVLRRERNGLLHASDGPALDWGGTMPFYMWHGEEVSRKAVGPTEELRVWDIREERNRRARDLMLERYGLARYFDEVGKRIQQDDTGTLWRAGVIWAVEVVNGTPEPDGSYRRYFLRVPPYTRSAREAVAWTYGLRRRDYRVAVRT